MLTIDKLDRFNRGIRSGAVTLTATGDPDLAAELAADGPELIAQLYAARTAPPVVPLDLDAMALLASQLNVTRFGQKVTLRGPGQDSGADVLALVAAIPELLSLVRAHVDEHYNGVYGGTTGDPALDVLNGEARATELRRRADLSPADRRRFHRPGEPRTLVADPRRADGMTGSGVDPRTDAERAAGVPWPGGRDARRPGDPAYPNPEMNPGLRGADGRSMTGRADGMPTGVGETAERADGVHTNDDGFTARRDGRDNRRNDGSTGEIGEQPRPGVGPFVSPRGDGPPSTVGDDPWPDSPDRTRPVGDRDPLARDANLLPDDPARRGR